MAGPVANQFFLFFALTFFHSIDPSILQFNTRPKKAMLNWGQYYYYFYNYFKINHFVKPVSVFYKTDRYALRPMHWLLSNKSPQLDSNPDLLFLGRMRWPLKNEINSSLNIVLQSVMNTTFDVATNFRAQWPWIFVFQFMLIVHFLNKIRRWT
jgi:hypothetical protein